MQTFEINVVLIRWILFIVVTGFYFYVTRKNSRRSGFLTGLDNILPTFWYFLFIIGWLITFFIIL